MTTEWQAKADEMSAQVKTKTVEVADNTRATAHIKADSIAQALRAAGDALEGRGEPGIARYGRDLADRVQRFSGYVEQRNVGGLIDDMEDGARRRPGAFVGGTFAAGLLVGRFLRSSRSRQEAGSETLQPTEASLPSSATPRRESLSPAAPASPASPTSPGSIEAPPGRGAGVRTGGAGMASAAAGGVVAGSDAERERTTRATEVDHD